MPKELSMPDSDGWWWLKQPDRNPQLVRVPSNGQCITIHGGATILLSDIAAGRWIKAEAPAFPEPFPLPRIDLRLERANNKHGTNFLFIFLGNFVVCYSEAGRHEWSGWEMDCEGYSNRQPVSREEAIECLFGEKAT